MGYSIRSAAMLLGMACVSWTASGQTPGTTTLGRKMGASSPTIQRLTRCVDTVRVAIRRDMSPVPRDVDVYAEFRRRDSVSLSRATDLAKACMHTISVADVPPEHWVALASVQFLAEGRPVAASTLTRLATLPDLPATTRYTLLHTPMLTGFPMTEFGVSPDSAVAPLARALITLADSVGHPRERVAYRLLLANAIRRTHAPQVYSLADQVLALLGQLEPKAREDAGPLSVLTDSMTVWAERDGIPQRVVGFAVRMGTLFPDTARFVTAVSALYHFSSTFGAVAPPIVAPRWINSPAGTTEMTMGLGKVTLIEFTNWACGICKYTYKPMVAWHEALNARGFQAVIATALLGSFEGGDPLTPEQEAIADSGYYVGRYGIRFPIAIDSNMITDANMRRYRVFGAPQFVLVDRRGIIRNGWYGWDKKIEAAIDVEIRKLLAE